ncbi:MAG TPA: alpha/beta hydrolase fold domain-containing protein [Acidimicrobiales bacterium]|nr:alpha/beta hydrolase fold domain-containing protein [Acidimicrobiales bacterium]
MAHPGIDVIRQLVGAVRHQGASIPERRASLAALAGSPPAPDGVAVEAIELADRPAERLTPAGAPSGDVVLYLHGGSYHSGSPDTHRGLAGALALAAGRTVVTLDYRLAPEDPFPAGLNDALLAFDQLAPARVALAGDSAGGGLAAATALALRDRAGGQPVAVALISPWTDLTQSAGSYTSRAAADPMLTAAALDQAAEAYLAGTDPRTSYVSPVFGDLAGLPPVRVDVGADEVLFDDSQTLVEGITAAGGDAVLVEWPEMIHVFQAFPPDLVPEAAHAVAAMGAFLAGHFDASRDRGA